MFSKVPAWVRLLPIAAFGAMLTCAQAVNPGITAVPARIQSAAGATSAVTDVYSVPPTVEPVAFLNRRLPPWIRLDALERVRWEGFRGLGYIAGRNDAYLLNRFRLGLLLEPAPWLRVYSEGQDARVAGKSPPVGPPNQSEWDLRQAYIELGGDEQRVSLKVGRQEVNFGAGRLIGRSDWRNAGRTYDAALASLRAGRFRVTAFSLSVVVPRDHGLSHHQNGVAIHGLYGAIDALIPHSVLEPYVFWRVAPGYRTESGTPARLDEHTVGLRWAGMLTSRFDYAAEAVGQTGHIASDAIRAALLSLVGGYTVPPLRGRPRIFAEYFYASGDGHAGDGRHNTFHQLHPTHHDRNGLADQVGWQNLNEIRAGAQFTVARNWIIAGEYNDWRLANAKDALYDTSGVAVARDATGRSGTHIGQEFDLEMSYRINRPIELVAGIGHIMPGEFLKRTTPGAPCTYPYVGMTYFF